MCWLVKRGGKLTAKQIVAIRADLVGRDNNRGAPYWTDRVGALLDHIALIEAELEWYRRPLLPGMK